MGPEVVEEEVLDFTTDNYDDYHYDADVDYIDWWQTDNNDYMHIEDNWWVESDITESEPILQGWFTEKAMPFFQFHKNDVYENAMSRAEDDFGPLLDTCREGSECRTEKRAIMMESLRKEWKSTIDSFKTQVEASLDWTEDEIVRVYGDLVQCEADHPCCDTASEVVVNWYK